MKKKFPLLPDNEEDAELLRFLKKYERMVETEMSEYFDADVLIDILEYYSQNMMNKEAHSCAEYALKLYPDNTDALVYMARERMQLADLDGARKLEAKISDVSDSEVKFLHAEILLTEGKVEEAQQFLQEQFNDENQVEPMNYYDIATIFRDFEQYKIAIDWINKFYTNEKLELFYNNQLKADCLTMLGNTNESIPLLNALLDEQPYDAFSWELLAQAQISEGNLNDAIDCCDFAIAINPDELVAIRLKALCFYKLENFNKAIELFLSLNTPDYEEKEELFLQIAMCYEGLGNMEETISWLEKAKKIVLPMIKSKKGEKPHFIDDEKLVTRDSFILSILLHLSECYSDVGNYEQAEVNALLAHLCGKIETEFYIMCGLISLKQDDYETTLNRFQIAILCEDRKAEDMLEILEILNKSNYLPIAQSNFIVQMKSIFPELEIKLYAHEAFVALHLGTEDEFVEALKKALWFDFAYTKQVFLPLLNYEKASEFMANARALYKERQEEVIELQKKLDALANSENINSKNKIK
ncbi:MAG: hypothetical protein RRY07_00310 [Bacteroidaceae bacterium]